jgi:hypothetical protein
MRPSGVSTENAGLIPSKKIWKYESVRNARGNAIATEPSVVYPGSGTAGERESGTAGGLMGDP